MAICAVFGCDTTKDKRCKNYAKNGDIKLHSFPKDPQMAKIWERKCGRKDKINAKYAFICSKHFTKEQYKRNLQHELLSYMPKNYRNLKDDAVPAEELPLSGASSKEIKQKNAKRNKGLQRTSEQSETLSLVNESIKQEDQSIEIPAKSPKEQELQETILELERQIDALKKEKQLLRTKVLQLRRENFELRQECSTLNNISSATQEKKTSRPVKRKSNRTVS